LKNALVTLILPQLDGLIARFEELKRRHKYLDWSDIDLDEAQQFLSAGVSAIHRAAGPNSSFAAQAEKAIEQHPTQWAPGAIPHIGGILKALRHAVDSGYLVSVQELFHAAVFADFLEMAEHLISEGYKDPAAVLIGGVLERHLRELCDKNGISSTFKDSKGVSRPKKAEAMNTELAGSNIYSKLDQKSVTAWLDLRNKAAHGRYNEYTQQQVKLLLQSVRDFLARHPA